MEQRDLEIRVALLEKMLDRALDSVTTAAVASKTADKALAMAQEALVVVTSAQQQVGPPMPEMTEDEIKDFEGMSDVVS